VCVFFDDNIWPFCARQSGFISARGQRVVGHKKKIGSAYFWFVASISQCNRERPSLFYRGALFLYIVKVREARRGRKKSDETEKRLTTLCLFSV